MLSLDKIQFLYLEITSHCNIRCPQCSRTHPMGNLADFIELKHLDLDRVLPNLEKEKLTNLTHVHIEGDNGDAFMHPGILKILDFFMDAPANPNISMLTNGGMRNTSWWYNLGQRYAGRLRVQFSIDGLADTNPLYRVDVDHNKVVDNARAFLAGGGEGTQRCLIFKHNQHQIEDIVKASHEIGFYALSLEPNDDKRFQGRDKWAVYDRDFNITHYIENTTLQNVGQWNYDNTKIQFPPNRVINHNTSCTWWRTGMIYVSYKGHIIPCCDMHSDLEFKHSSNNEFQSLVGDKNLIDIHQHKLSTIIESSKFYGHTLDQRLKNGNPLLRCQNTCPNAVSNGKKIIPIIAKEVDQ